MRHVVEVIAATKSGLNVCGLVNTSFSVFLPLVYWRSLLLHSSLQSAQTPICQHGCANRSGNLHSLHLLTDCPDSGHGGEGKSQPHHLLRYTADALCLHLLGTLAGADSQGLS